MSSPWRASAAFSGSRASLRVRLGAREPRVERRLFRAERLHLALERRLLGEKRLARVGLPLPRRRLGALLRLAIGGRARVASPSRGIVARAPAQRQHPVAVVVEIAVERRDACRRRRATARRSSRAAGGGRARRRPARRRNPAAPRSAPRASRCRGGWSARRAAAGSASARTISASVRRAFSPPEKWRDRRRRHVAAKIEAAEEVAQLLLARCRARSSRRCHSGDSSSRSCSTWCCAK